MKVQCGGKNRHFCRILTAVFVENVETIGWDISLLPADNSLPNSEWSVVVKFHKFSAGKWKIFLRIFTKIALEVLGSSAKI